MPQSLKLGIRTNPLKIDIYCISDYLYGVIEIGWSLALRFSSAYFTKKDVQILISSRLEYFSVSQTKFGLWELAYLITVISYASMAHWPPRLSAMSEVTGSTSPDTHQVSRISYHTGQIRLI